MYNEVQFDEQTTGFSRKDLSVEQKSKMVKLFEKMGVPEEYVSVVMIVVAVVFFAVTVLVFFSNNSGIKRLSPDKIIKVAGPSDKSSY